MLSAPLRGSISERLFTVGVVTPLLLLFLLFHFARNLGTASFQGDESVYIALGSEYWHLWSNDRFEHPSWKDYRGVDQPQIGRYLIGALVEWLGGKELLLEVRQMKLWYYDRTYDWNRAHHRVPPEHVWFAVRCMSSLFAVGACLFLYFAYALCGHPLMGVLWAVLVASHPLTMSVADTATLDAVLLFAMSMSFVLVLLFYRSLQRGYVVRSLLIAAAIGAAVSFSAGVKLNGGLSGIIFALLLVYLFACRILLSSSLTQIASKESIAFDVGYLFLAGTLSAGIAFGLFYNFSPNLYGAPFSGLKRMWEHRIEVSAEQQAHVKPEKRTDTWSKKIDSTLAKSSLQPLFSDGYNKRFVHVLSMVLALTGLLFLLFDEFTFVMRHGTPSMAGVFLIYVLTITVGTLAWLPIGWKRYYVPVIPCFAFLTTFGILRTAWSLKTRLFPIDGVIR